MKQRANATINRPSVRALTLIVVLAVSLSGSVKAAETASENAQLAALLRQLDTLERLAQDASKINGDGATRYHFDYARLYADIARIRAGVEDYSSPPRAQPRDASILTGQYRAENADTP